jgi:hypothetical protein
MQISGIELLKARVDATRRESATVDALCMGLQTISDTLYLELKQYGFDANDALATVMMQLASASDRLAGQTYGKG